MTETYMSDQTVLDRLKDGVRRFQSEVYAANAGQYQRAATRQRPHTLMIACADSRVDVESITSAEPGEIFVARNIGNMIPGYGEMMGNVSAVIEYAVSALKVRHVVVCGHSDCGAMKALLHPSATATMPAVKNWLSNGLAALAIAETMDHQDDRPGERLRRLTEENVRMQIAHLKTHPSVAGARALGELTISGWFYEIGTGDIRIVEDGDGEFVPVRQATRALSMERKAVR
jgi:carbonic anhydrase